MFSDQKRGWVLRWVFYVFWGGEIDKKPGGFYWAGLVDAIPGSTPVSKTNASGFNIAAKMHLFCILFSVCSVICKFTADVM